MRIFLAPAGAYPVSRKTPPSPGMLPLTQFRRFFSSHPLLFLFLLAPQVEYLTGSSQLSWLIGNPPLFFLFSASPFQFSSTGSPYPRLGAGASSTTEDWVSRLLGSESTPSGPFSSSERSVISLRAQFSGQAAALSWLHSS